MNPLLSISKEVQHALDNNLPVVALESTIISHECHIHKTLKWLKR